MTRRIVRLAAVLIAAAFASGHVGDTATHFRGSAGPYTVQVVVRHPGVVPGLSDIAIRVERDGVRTVSVQPVRWDVGLAGSPRPDLAVRAAADPTLWTAQLWFMTTGAYSVYVHVDGDAGSGIAVVPISSIATQQLFMGQGLGVVLALLGLLLVAGLITIVRAAVRESTLEPGLAPDARARRGGRIAVLASLAFVVLIASGGRSWWRAEESAYRSILYEPLATEVRQDVEDGVRVLRISLVDSAWQARRFTPFMPDHGKFMHLFLVREDLGAFAHAHPQMVHTDSFRLALPPLPPGRYRFYGDVVHQSGFAQTLTDTVQLENLASDSAGSQSAPPKGDPDDAWWTGEPAVATETSGLSNVTFDDGATVTWIRPEAPVRSGVAYAFQFVVRDADGAPAALEPYMGMPAHVAVTRDDGNVFVHLHPNGTISMAAMDAIRRAEPATSTTVAAVPDHPPVTESQITVPWAFPKPGAYRLWIQIRLRGTVRTAAFDVTAEPEL